MILTMPRKRRQVAMDPSRAIQLLRRMKNIQSDDLGDLGFILASETSSLVKCHNHSFTVAMQKQMDIWYRHHVTTMRKISHGQQSEYRNLMKVKNDKRRMFRSGVMRQREEDEFDHRMKVDRDRNDAEVKLLKLTLEDDRDEPEVDDEIDLARKEADRSGWLRIRRRDQLNSSDLLPTIHDIVDDGHRDSSPTFGLPIVDEDWEYTRKHIADGDFYDQNGHSTFVSESHRTGDINSFTLDSAVNNELDDDDEADTMRRDLPTTDRLGHTSDDDESKHIQTISEANRSYQDLGDRSRELKGLRSAPAINHSVKNDAEKTNESIVAIHPVTDMITKRDADAVLESRERDNGVMIDTKDVEISQTKHVQKLPSLHMQPIDQVTRYHRQETDRALVGTVTAVKPSAEKFPVPSKKPQYHRRKALQWHVEQAPALHTKIQQFLSECDAVPRPAPSLQTRPVFFFSRHNPILTTSVDHADTVHRTDTMTKRRNEILHDVEAEKLEESVIQGHSVAITKEMVNRKHGVMTPHK